MRFRFFYFGFLGFLKGFFFGKSIHGPAR